MPFDRDLSMNLAWGEVRQTGEAREKDWRASAGAVGGFRRARLAAHFRPRRGRKGKREMVVWPWFHRRERLGLEKEIVKRNSFRFAVGDYPRVESSDPGFRGIAKVRPRRNRSRCL